MKVKSTHCKGHIDFFFRSIFFIVFSISRSYRKNTLLLKSSSGQKSLTGSYHDPSPKQKEIALCPWAPVFRKSIPRAEVERKLSKTLLHSMRKIFST